MGLPSLVELGLGLLVLALGADVLVRGAAGLAARLGISPLVVGLTVVALGTSAPEIAVTVHAAAIGRSELAVGNVLGSCIFNVLCILGVSALIAPLAVSHQLVRRDVPIMIGASALTLLLSLDHKLQRGDGLLLLALLAVYLLLSVRQARRDRRAAFAHGSFPDAAGEQRGHRPGKQPGKRLSAPVQALMVVVGLVGLVAGARWMVDASVSIARSLGVSELIIGLTIVAVGTSLPEAATSILAAARGERDIAVGNIVGSNVFNLLAVLGMGATVAPGGMPVAPGALRLDFPVMVASAAACFPVFLTGHRIARWEGGLFFGYYLAYTAYLLLESTRHDLMPAFNLVMLAVVMPLTAVTLVVSLVRSARETNGGSRRGMA